MILQIALYAIVVAAAASVVFTTDPKKTIFMFSFYGTALAMLFLVLQAPDVALSEVAVGSAAVPLVTFVALTKMTKR